MLTNPEPAAILKTGDALNETDYANLARRWIDRSLAIEAGIRRVDSTEGSLLVGRNNRSSYEGLAIPYFLPGEAVVREWRLRRDHPDMERRDGKYKESGKYLSPPGRKNMIYFVPGLQPSLLNLIATPIIVTEGEFKTLALWRLANHDSANPRFLPLGLGGVWNWRGTIGKTNGPNGDRRDVKGPIPDLDLVTWEGRRVILAFDADASENPQVETASTNLARELRMRGAEVGYFRWNIEDGKGIDDLLANLGPKKVLELLGAVDWDKKDAAESISVDKIAEAITKRHCFARDRAGRLYVFKDGCYQPDGASFVRQIVKQILNRISMASKWTSHRSEEVAKYIEVDAPSLWEAPKPDLLNVRNGLLDVHTRVLSPHSPDFLSPIQLPVTFDPSARCPAWDKFVGEVFPEDAEALGWEIPAWLMTPDVSIQKAILLMGDGANGKSTYLRAVLAFIGKHNTAAVSLQKLENDRFASARLIGRLANICPDLPSTDLASTSVFKAITGGDALTAEHKFRDSFDFNPYARLVFSANHPPRSQDASPAFFRRWIVIPFERIFIDGAPETISSDDLNRMLSNPTELSGVLNKALAALLSIRRNGFTESECTRRAMGEFRATTDPFAVWLDQHTTIEPDALIPCGRLWQDYREDCVSKGRPIASKTALGRAISQLRPSIEKYQRSVNGKTSWCYVGIGFRVSSSS
jgi:P4 family phage/plasmid primase-like protien